MIAGTNNKSIVKWGIAALIVAAASAALLVQGCKRAAPEPAKPPAPQPAATEKIAQEWTCPMHPQVREKQPGKCPICGMNLVQVTKEAK